MRPLPAFRLLIGLATILLVPARLPAADSDWKIERWQWERAIGTNRTLTVVNLHGDVRARDAGNDVVLVSAVIQRHERDAHRAHVGVAADGGRMTVDVNWVVEGEPSGREDAAAFRKRRVDLTVFVPPGVVLDVRTDRGDVQANGMQGDVVAASSWGDVDVSNTGRVTARTERGAINVTLGAGDWSGDVTLATLTGDVAVWLPPAFDATVEAETFGEITTDYSIEISRRPGSSKKYARATLGSGEGRRLSITTNRGRLKFRRLPIDIHVDAAPAASTQK